MTHDDQTITITAAQVLESIVSQGRNPEAYTKGQLAATVDGRFDCPYVFGTDDHQLYAIGYAIGCPVYPPAVRIDWERLTQ